VHTTYTNSQFLNETLYLAQSYSPITGPLTAIFSDLTATLFNSGITNFLDADGRAIIYSESISTPTDLNIDPGVIFNTEGDYIFVDSHAPLLANAAHQNGVRWVGGSGVDIVSAGIRDDFLQGHGGDDILEGRAGADILDGGDGADTASYVSSTFGVTVDLAGGNAYGGDAIGDTLVSIENLRGSNSDDIFIGNDTENRLEGRGGDDTLVGGEGVDALYGGAGSDLLIAGTLTDTAAGSGTGGAPEIIEGGADDDYIVLSDADSDTITINGGDTSDHLLLTPHMTERESDSDGSLPLIEIVGGWASTTGSYYLDYNGGLIFHQPANNVFVYEDGTKSKSYIFQLGGTENWGVTYEWFFEQSRLEIIAYYGFDGTSEKNLKITINDFSEGDYGIELKEFHVADFYEYDDNGALNYTDVLPDAGALVVYTNKLIVKADNYKLTSDLEIESSANMKNFAALTETTSSLQAEHLVMQIDGDVGDDTLEGVGLKEHIYGHSGNDLLVGGGGADLLDGGDGVDTADYRTSSAAVSVDLATNSGSGGDAEGDTLYFIENISGSAFDDILSGESSANLLQGMGGNDQLFGGEGDDLLQGGEGADVIDGGAGTDTADYSTALSGVTVSLASPSAGTGDAEGDTFVSVENLLGSDFADTLTGNSDTNHLSGVDGDDTLSGMGGIDYLVGGAGSDTLTGGTEADVFVFKAGFGDDTVTDFLAGEDSIWLEDVGFDDFSDVLANATDTAAGAVINITGHGTIALAGITVAQLHADDFIFA
jgi:Ca2+-binding RTX toxin-like protein